MAFIDQVKGANTTLRAVVIFYGNDYEDGQTLNNYVTRGNSAVITMRDEPIDLGSIVSGNPPYEQIPDQEEQLSPKYFSALKKFPKIKESINIDTRKYSISSVKLSLFNIQTPDGYLSDLLDSNFFRINKSVEIRYYPNNSTKNYFTAFKGKIKYASHTREDISIELEDSSQDVLFKDVPVNYTPDTEEIIEKSRNIPYPMVYGKMKKSPVIYVSNRDAEYGDEYALDSKFYIDYETAVLKNTSPPPPITINDGGLQAFPSVLSVGKDGKYLHIARYSLDIGSTDDQNLDNFIDTGINSPYLELNSVSYSEDYEGVNNDVKNLELRCFVLRQPKGLEFTYINSTDEVLSSAWGIINSESSDITPDNLIYHEGNILRDDYLADISEISNGTKKLVLCDRNGETLSGMQKIDTFYNSNEQNSPNFEGHFCTFIYDEIPMDFSCKTFLIGRFNCTLSSNTIDTSYNHLVQQGFQLFLSKNKSVLEDTIPLSNLLSYNPQYLVKYYKDSVDSNGIDAVDMNNRSSRFAWTNVENANILWDSNSITSESDLIDYTSTGLQGSPLSDTWNSFNQASVLTLSTMPTRANGFNQSFYDNDELSYAWSKLELNYFNLYQTGSIYAFWEKDYYADVDGRTGGFNGENAPAEMIIRDIVETELERPDVVETFNPLGISGVNYAFTQNKKINSKKLIEELASYTNIFPIFKNNKLRVKSIEKEYDINHSYKQILAYDVRDHSFSRSDVRDLYSKLTFNYNYDFSSSNYTKSITLDASLISPDYDPTFYNLVDAEKTIDCRFIYDDASAQEIAKYLLMSNCNPHNIASVTLPLNYINYELGDIVRFDALLNSQKMYGEDYTKIKYGSNGQWKYGLFIISSMQITDKSVKLSLYQLHDLETWYIKPTTFYNYCPLNTDPSYANNVLGLDSWVDGVTGEEFYTNNIDGIVYNDDGTTAQYIPNNEYCVITDLSDENIVDGCMNSDAVNYNPNANIDIYDSCIFAYNEPTMGKFSSQGDFFNFYLLSGVYDVLDSTSNVFFEFDTFAQEGYTYFTPQDLNNNTILIDIPNDETGTASDITPFHPKITMYILLPKSHNNNGSIDVYNGDSTWDKVGFFIKTQGRLYHGANMEFSFNTLALYLGNTNEEFIISDLVDAMVIPNGSDAFPYVVTAIQSNNAWMLRVKIPMVHGMDYLDEESMPNIDVPHIRYGFTIPPVYEYIDTTDTIELYSIALGGLNDIPYLAFRNYSGFFQDELFPTSSNRDVTPFGVLFECNEHYAFTQVADIPFDIILAIYNSNDYSSVIMSHYSPLNLTSFWEDFINPESDIMQFFGNSNSTNYTNYYMSIGSNNNQISNSLLNAKTTIECIISEQLGNGLPNPTDLVSVSNNVSIFTQDLISDNNWIYSGVNSLRDYIKYANVNSGTLNPRLKISIVEVSQNSGIMNVDGNWRFNDEQIIESTLVDDGTYSTDTTAGEIRTTHLISIEDLSILWDSDYDMSGDYRRKLKFEFNINTATRDKYYFIKIERPSIKRADFRAKVNSFQMGGDFYYANTIFKGNYFIPYLTMSPTGADDSFYHPFDLDTTGGHPELMALHTFRVHSHNVLQVEDVANTDFKVYQDITTQSMEEVEPEIDVNSTNEIGVYAYNSLDTTGVTNPEASFIGNPDNEYHNRREDNNLYLTNIGSSLTTANNMLDAGFTLTAKFKDEDYTLPEEGTEE